MVEGQVLKGFFGLNFMPIAYGGFLCDMEKQRSESYLIQIIDSK